MYCAVTGSSNTVSVPSVTRTESLVQVTVVAGPPVEIIISKGEPRNWPIEVRDNNELYVRGYSNMSYRVISCYACMINKLSFSFGQQRTVSQDTFPQ